MKIYNIKDKVKWTKRVKWLKALIMFIIIIAILFPLLYFVVGEQTELLRAIITSLVISSLITGGYIYSNVLSYEPVTYVVDGKKLFLIIEQKEKDFYNTNIELNRNIDYENKDTIKKLLSMKDKITGIAIFEAKKYDIIKEKDNKCKVSFEGVYNTWKYYDRKKDDFGYEMKSFDKKKVTTIDDKYNDYKELIEFIK